MTLTYTPLPGGHVYTECEEVVRVANLTGQKVNFCFNGIDMSAKPGDTAKAIASKWHELSNRRHEEWLRSSAGIESQRRAAESKRIAEIESKKPFASFAIRDPAAWDLLVKNNPEPYGQGVLRYAARWAWMMDSRINGGESVAKSAEQTKHIADREGITGAMFGFAVGVLSRCWVHGDELKSWYQSTI